MNLFRVNDIVRKTRKGLVKSHAFDKRNFGVVVKTTKTKVYVIPNNTHPISVNFRKKFLDIKVDPKDIVVFPMQKLVNKYDHIFREENV